MLLFSFIDVTHSENLHWLAIAGSAILLSAASSIVPNYLESSLDVRSHNHARLLNETGARMHFAYMIFLVALITSDDIDRESSVFTWLVTVTLVLVFILIVSIMLSGRTVSRINKYRDRQGNRHQCKPIGGVCDSPIGWWLYTKVCFPNAVMALAVGLFCLWLSVSPSVIKHGPLRLSETELLQNQRKDYSQLFQLVYNHIALQTKEQFERSVINLKDEKYKDKTLNVSYWINYEGTLYQLGRTEEHPPRMTFPLDKTSIIGCGFAHKNHTVQFEDKIGRSVILSFNEEPAFEDANCLYAIEAQRKLKSIACTSYNANGTPETTVGICIFTESERKILINNYHNFLRTKAEDFYKLISPALINKQLVPHG